MLRFLTAGESHGRGLVVIVEGLPAGLTVTVEEINAELARRRLGFGRGPRMRFEKDDLAILAGVRHGRTLGSPVAVEIGNSEWERKWTEEMSAAPGETAQPLTKPRPGHADLAGMQKYDFTDARNVLERASARETAARVAAGALAKALLRSVGIEIVSHVIQLGSVRADPDHRPGPTDLAAVDDSEVRCFDPDAEAGMIAEIRAAQKDGDSLGGIVEVLAYGVPVGLGSHVHWDRKLDGLLAEALLSIQAVKGVEIGDGFDVAVRRGSEAHDAIGWDDEAGEYRRESSRAGGIEGGMSTGEVLVAHVAMKPLATLNRPTLKTVDTATKEETVSFKERTDVTAVPAMGVVAETMMALVLADELTRKFGGDSVSELVRNLEGFLMQTKEATARVIEPPDDGIAPLNWDESQAFRDDFGTTAMSGPHLVLIGMMGAGKSTVGRLLSGRLDRPFLDSDELIEAETGRTVAQIFADDGEAAFRAIETDVLTQMLDRERAAVIAAAGGAVLDPANRAHMRARGTVVWLRVDPSLLVERVKSGEHRPLLEHDPAATLARLASERESLYRETAHEIVDVADLSPNEVADRVLSSTGAAA